MPRRYLIAAEFLVLVVLMGWLGWYALKEDPGAPADAISIKMQIRGANDRVYLFEESPGKLKYRLVTVTGTPIDLTADEFSKRLYHDRKSRSALQVLLNVSGPLGMAWVALGFLGQLLFTGRMVVQWLASEKEKRSVVPPIFWWMSLIGSTMLLLYFVWRRDPVGVMGQAVGWFIYVRNLAMIYSVPKLPATKE